MSKLKFPLFGLVLAALMASCSTSNDVVSNRSVQKRKYNDGFYISFNRGNHKLNKKNQEEDNLPANDQIAQTMDEIIAPQEQSTNPDVRSYIDNVEIEEVGTYAETGDLIPENEDKGFKEALTDGFARSAEIFMPVRVKNPFKADRSKRTGTIENNGAASDDAMIILLVILALFIPPLAVFIFEGATGRFWIDLILAIIGWGVGWYFLGGLGWICGLAAVIYAILIVLSVI